MPPPTPTRPSHSPLAALDWLATLVAVVDGQGAVHFANAALEDAIGLSRRSLDGVALHDWMHDSQAFVDALKRVQEQGFAAVRYDATLKRLHDDPLPVHVVLAPGGREGEFIAELLPLEQQARQEREERLIDQAQANKELIRNLAHEIKNPLGGIRGAAQLLARELPDEGLRDYTNVIIEEADRLRNLVDRMLGSNKLPSLAMTNIHEVLERVASLIEAEAQGSITLVRDYDPSIPDLLIDREQLIQAVLNIVRNALQALSSQSDLRLGRISLRTRTLRQFTIGHTRHRLVVKMEIIDNGPGIPPELQETIFYPMVSGRPDGTGLGLAITQNIISQHQGLIECESHPGHTVFSIFLPLDQGATPS